MRAVELVPLRTMDADWAYQSVKAEEVSPLGAGAS